MLPGTRRLMLDDAPVVIGARAFDLLQCLIECRERVVSKDDLIRRIWPQTVVGENNLNVQVATLRKLLGAQAVVTVAGHGYRFGLELKVPQIALDHLQSLSAPLALPDKPSIAVLPFLNLSDDPQQAFLADGVTEDLNCGGWYIRVIVPGVEAVRRILQATTSSPVKRSNALDNALYQNFHHGEF